MDIVWGGNRDPGFNQRIKEWIEGRIWNGRSELPDCLAMGIFDNGILCAGVAFHDWQPAAGVIEISAASDSKRWLTRPVLKAIFEYPFLEIGCQMVVARIDASNASLLRIFKAYGFSDVRIPRLLGRDKDVIVLTLTDDAWRASKFNQQKDDHIGQAKSS